MLMIREFSKLGFSHSRQHGFTMIEVLVTIVILSIGLLGLASLQANGLRTSYSAYQRSLANSLAYDIIDRMRANRPRGISNVNNMVNNYTLAMSDTPSDVTCTSCTASQMARKDKYQWMQLLKSARLGLPEADGAIAVTGRNMPGDTDTANDVVEVTVTIEWNDERFVNDGNPNNDKIQFQVQAQL